MKKTVACIIARTNSTRLPNKVLLEIVGVKMIEYIIRKIKKSKNIDEIYLCTSVDEDDSILLKIAAENGIKSYAGSKLSVIDRMLKVADLEKADNVVRITGDNIFTDEIYLDLMVKYHHANNADYTRVENLPIGITPEIINVKALQNCYKSINPDESQYLMLYMFQPDKYKCVVLIPESKHNKPNMTFTVDTPDDFTRTKKIIEGAKSNKLLNLNDILDFCSNNEVSNTVYKTGNSVKLPANLEFTFKAFRTEMEIRLEKATQVHLQKGEYK